MQMEPRRGRGARRDGAVRREVRRLGAGGRGRRRLARALRRHPRREHGRGRDLRDRLRGLERRQRAPDRGAHRARRRSTGSASGATRSTEAGALLGSPRDPLRRGPSARPSAWQQLEKQAELEAQQRGAGRRPTELGVDRGRHRRREGRDRAARRRRPAARCSTSPTGQGEAGRRRRSCSAAPNDGTVALVASFTRGAVERGLSAAEVVREAPRRSWAAGAEAATTSRRPVAATRSGSRRRLQRPARRSSAALGA